MTLQYAVDGKTQEIRLIIDPPIEVYDEVKPRLIAMREEALEGIGMVRASPPISKNVTYHGYSASQSRVDNSTGSLSVSVPTACMVYYRPHIMLGLHDLCGNTFNRCHRSSSCRGGTDDQSNMDICGCGSCCGGSIYGSTLQTAQDRRSPWCKFVALEVTAKVETFSQSLWTISVLAFGFPFWMEFRRIVQRERIASIKVK